MAITAAMIMLSYGRNASSNTKTSAEGFKLKHHQFKSGFHRANMVEIGLSRYNSRSDLDGSDQHEKINFFLSIICTSIL